MPKTPEEIDADPTVFMRNLVRGTDDALNRRIGQMLSWKRFKNVTRIRELPRHPLQAATEQKNDGDA